jgi:hypothetical protein
VMHRSAYSLHPPQHLTVRNLEPLTRLGHLTDT